MIGSFLSSGFASPHIMVVHPSGTPIAPANELSNHTDELAPDAQDPGLAAGEGHADAESAEGGDGDPGGDGGYEGGDAGDLNGGGDFGGDFGDGFD
jgi:hypothetical protein